MAQTQATQINVPFIDQAGRHLHLAVGACRLKIRAGDPEPWVSGSYDDPTGDLPWRLAQQGATIKITQQHDLGGLMNLLSGVPSFDLALGSAHPYALTLESGASENSLDLGGLPIQRLLLKHGAGKLDVDFSIPNPELMSLLELHSGAAAVELRRLANAHFSEMVLDGGAAAYRLDFGGTFRRDAHVRISTGLSSVELSIPASTAAKVTAESVLGSLDVGDGWTKRGGAFWTEAATRGESPVLSITTSVALGSLQLR